MNIQRKDNGRSDRVSRGETDESRTDIRCREKEESDRIISGTMDKVTSFPSSIERHQRQRYVGTP